MMFKIASARHLKLGLAALALALAWAAPARAQEEGVPVVLDEPIVQVNNDVIMLSHLKRETEELPRGAHQAARDDREAGRRGDREAQVRDRRQPPQRGAARPEGQGHAGHERGGRGRREPRSPARRPPVQPAHHRGAGRGDAQGRPEALGRARHAAQALHAQRRLAERGGRENLLRHHRRRGEEVPRREPHQVPERDALGNLPQPRGPRRGAGARQGQAASRRTRARARTSASWP